jgi:hypothetical protein
MMRREWQEHEDWRSEEISRRLSDWKKIGDE